MLVVNNNAKQLFVCLFLAIFDPFLEKIAYGPLRPPPGPHGLSYYQKRMSQKDNQLWQSSGEVQNLAKNTPVRRGLEGVQFTHPLEEILNRTRWCPGKVQGTL